jgi:hypothetical protein
MSRAVDVCENAVKGRVANVVVEIPPPDPQVVAPAGPDL